MAEGALVIAEMNDYQFKIVKLQGDFIRHHHADTDETFLVIEHIALAVPHQHGQPSMWSQRQERLRLDHGVRRHT